MDKTLQILQIKLDSAMQTLTQRAIGQWLIKIIFDHETPITETEILNNYKSLARSSYNESSAKTALSVLVDNNNIKHDAGRYRLSNSKKKNIERSIKLSQDRLDYIADKYFSEHYSSKESIVECLIDSTICFFEMYSKEWISDINYGNHYITSSKESIVNTIERKIIANKSIDKRDKSNLIDMFINFINARNDSDVDAFLWEYGTSAFASKLIKASNSADTMSIERFSGSKCILDTNILINIGLDGGKYNSPISHMANVFQKLGVKVGIFNITKEEYEFTIANKTKTALHLVAKGYPIKILRETDDQFILAALERGCCTLEDFEEFFEQIKYVPKVFDNDLAIVIFHNDVNLDNIIANNQNDPHKLEYLNSLFYKLTNKDKNKKSLSHDVGIIAGADYLRAKEKAFILSQEYSVNSYSKKAPLEKGLPLSIKLETLINVLSINNDIESNDSEFVGLFASMIRSGLKISKDTFKAEDLLYMLEIEEQITQLPHDEISKIANKIHSMRVKGESNIDISLTLRREITGGKIKFKIDLDKAKSDISQKDRENTRLKNECNHTEKILLEMLKKEAILEYKSKQRRNCTKIFCSILSSLILIVTLYYLLGLDKNENATILICLITIVSGIMNGVLWKVVSHVKDIKNLYKNKKKIISEAINEKRKAKLCQNELD